MSQLDYRLECLKLAHRHDRMPGEVTATAEAYYRWLNGLPSDNREHRPDDSPKEGNKIKAPRNRTSPST